MELLDVNILVYAFRRDSPNHVPMKKWLDERVNGDTAFGVSDLAFSGFLRIVTHPRIFQIPSKMAECLTFIAEVRESSNFVRVNPGERHWSIFTKLCRIGGVKGNLVPDAYFAALAIEQGATWVTSDRDFARFPGLQWKHPLNP